MQDRRPWISLPFLLAACSPPEPLLEPVDTDVEVPDPMLTILYPPPDVGTLPINADGYIEDLLVVVKIDNFVFVDPDTSDVVVEGQGHWHLHLDPEPWYTHGHALYIQEDVPSGDVHLVPGNDYALRATLAYTNHTDYTCETCTVSLPFRAVSADPDTGP